MVAGSKVPFIVSQIWRGPPLSVISIRRIEPGDGDILSCLRLAALSDSPSAFSSTYSDESSRSAIEWAERVQASASGFDRATFFAFHSEEPVGIVGGYRENPESPIVELVSMWTAPLARRMGVGRDLIRALLAWAREGDAEAVGIWVTEGNASAVSLYTAAGFVQIQGREPLRSESSEQVIRMMLSLP